METHGALLRYPLKCLNLCSKESKLVLLSLTFLGSFEARQVKYIFIKITCVSFPLIHLTRVTV